MDTQITVLKFCGIIVYSLYKYICTQVFIGVKFNQLVYIPVAAVSSSLSTSLSAIVIYQCYICNMYCIYTHNYV